MANQGAKKRKEENTRHMKRLFQVIIACNVIYLLVRAGISYSSFTWKHIIGLLLTSLAYALPYKQLDSMAKPSYGDDGEMFDGGYDMSTGGICGYLHLQHTSFPDLSKDFYLKVQRMLKRTRRPERRERNWRRKLQEPNWSKQELVNSALHCNDVGVTENYALADV